MERDYQHATDIAWQATGQHADSYVPWNDGPKVHWILHEMFVGALHCFDTVLLDGQEKGFSK